MYTVNPLHFIKVKKKFGNFRIFGVKLNKLRYKLTSKLFLENDMKRVGGNCVGVYLEYQYRIRPGTHRYHRLDMKSEPDSVRRRPLRLSSKYKTKFA